MVGTITGMSQFFRSIGGTIGVAAFGALMLYFFNARLPLNLPANLPPSVVRSLSNPLASRQLEKDIQVRLGSDPNGQIIAAHIAKQVRTTLLSSIDAVFMIYAIILLFAVGLNLFLDELPLRSAKSSLYFQETLEQP
jgi:hypothetical protein